jgi:hypothetical protein
MGIGSAGGPDHDWTAGDFTEVDDELSSRGTDSFSYAELFPSTNGIVTASSNTTGTASFNATVAVSFFPDTDYVSDGAGPQVEFIGSHQSTADASSYTFSSVDLGWISGRTGVLVAVAARSASSNEITGVTIDGVTATRVSVDTTGDNQTEIWAAATSTNATGDVVVTFAGTALRCGIAVYRGEGMSDITSPTDTYDGSGVSSFTLDHEGRTAHLVLGFLQNDSGVNRLEPALQRGEQAIESQISMATFAAHSYGATAGTLTFTPDDSTNRRWNGVSYAEPRTPYDWQAENGANDSNVVVTFPETATAGALLVAKVFTRATNITTPSGWTLAASADITGVNDVVAVFFKEATGTETQVTINVSPNDHIAAVVAQYSTPSFTTPVVDVDDASDGAGATGTSRALGSVTATAAGFAIGVIGARNGDVDGEVTWSDGFEDAGQHADAAGSSAATIAAAVKQVTAGSVSTTANWATSATHQGFLVVIKEDGGGGGGGIIPQVRHLLDRLLS